MPAGRKSKYQSHVKPYLGVISAWCKNGITEKQICRNLGVSVSKFNVYKSKYGELRESLLFGKDFADAIVENELYKNCVERDVSEVVTTEVSSPEGKKNVETKTTKKRVLGSVSAQKLWLMNRKPEQWREKLDVNAKVDGMESIAERMRRIESEYEREK